METVFGLLAILGGLALVGWVGVWSAARSRPVPARVDDGRAFRANRQDAAVIAVALGRADRMTGPGRHDERRCAF